MNSKLQQLLLLSFLASCLGVNPAAGVTVAIGPSQDNTLYEDLNGTLSNGAGPQFFAGVTGSGGPGILRGLILFDIASEVPASATITGATLSFNVSSVANVLADTITLNRVTTEWGEAGSVASGGGGGGGTGGAALPGDATWTHSITPSTAWTTPGGDFSETVSASISIGDVGPYNLNLPSLLDDLQDMLDSPQNNFGWILRGNESFDKTAKRFDSRESNNPPVLTIDYDLSSNGPTADFDGDTDVDLDDLGRWTRAFGADDGGDADADTDSDGADFLVWQREFTGPIGLQAATVPEPTTAALSLVFLALTTLNRRRCVSRNEISRK